VLGSAVWLAQRPGQVESPSNPAERQGVGKVR
jgi:hypothetical protein